jgi:DNA invertase Pin-like site-specific DNA recombinase
LRTSRAATGTSSAWRVSTDGQDAQLQRDDLRAAGCGRIYEEKASTRKATTDRPGLSAALDYLRAGDTLVAWKPDRLGRPVVMDADKLAAARARRKCGESPAQIAKARGISRATVYRHLAG